MDSGGYASQREMLMSRSTLWPVIACTSFSEAASLMKRMLWGLCLRGHSGSSVGGFTLGNHKVCLNIFLMAPPGTSDVGARGLHLQCLPSSGSAVALSEPACCGSFMSKTCKNQRRDERGFHCALDRMSSE